MPKILLIDDDPHIRDVVRFALEQANFEVTEAGDGAAGLAMFDPSQHTLVILDVMMPEMDGTEVCRRIRSAAATPIIFLSSRDDEIDRVLGLELGADDYVVKPFSPRELVARVKAMLRRLELDRPVTADDETQERVHGDLILNQETYRTKWRNIEVELTKTEFQLLWGMIRHPSKVFSRESLMQHAYDDPSIVVSDRTIDSHIRHIRQKFEAHDVDPIETVHGLGYRMGTV